MLIWDETRVMIVSMCMVREAEMSVESNTKYAGSLFQRQQGAFHGNVRMSGRLLSLEKGDTELSSGHSLKNLRWQSEWTGHWCSKSLRTVISQKSSQSEKCNVNPYFI